MEMKHTPGEWQWDVNPCDYDPFEEAPWLLSKTHGQILTGDIKCYNPADAKLIAAAPDLLRALDIALTLLKKSGFNSNDDEVTEGEAAIKKAIL